MEMNYFSYMWNVLIVLNVLIVKKSESFSNLELSNWADFTPAAIILWGRVLFTHKHVIIITQINRIFVALLLLIVLTNKLFLSFDSKLRIARSKAAIDNENIQSKIHSKFIES